MVAFWNFILESVIMGEHTMRYFVIAACFLVIGHNASAQDDDKVAMGSYKSPWTCKEVEDVKFDKVKYRELDTYTRQLVDAQDHQCTAPKDGDISVVMINPAPASESTRVMYGTITRAQLVEARKACATGGAIASVAINIATGGLDGGLLSKGIYQYSGVSCNGLAQGMESGNLMMILGPQQIVGAAVAGKVADDLIRNIPLISDADKKNMQKFVASAIAPPVVSVQGPNITAKSGTVSVSFQKPKVVISKKPLESLSKRLPKSCCKGWRL
jgi:hypothetical protein